MKHIIQRLVSLGMNLSTRRALRSALKMLGTRPDNVDLLYIELKNSINREAFRAVRNKHKILFLPQCLRDQNCGARLTEEGYKCVECGRKCKAFRIRKHAEKMNYRVFILPGGSMVFKLLRKFKPKAVAGIACLKELVIAGEGINGIPVQGVLLTRDGCVGTDGVAQKLTNTLIISINLLIELC